MGGGNVQGELSVTRDFHPSCVVTREISVDFRRCSRADAKQRKELTSHFASVT